MVVSLRTALGFGRFCLWLLPTESLDPRAPRGTFEMDEAGLRQLVEDAALAEGGGLRLVDVGPVFRRCCGDRGTMEWVEFREVGR